MTPPTAAQRAKEQDELLALVKQWREFARGLQREVDMGICIRQSAESKLARVEVLRSNADQLERILTASKEPGR